MTSNFKIEENIHQSKNDKNKRQKRRNLSLDLNETELSENLVVENKTKGQYNQNNDNLVYTPSLRLKYINFKRMVRHKPPLSDF